MYIYTGVCGVNYVYAYVHGVHICMCVGIYGHAWEYVWGLSMDVWVCICVVCVCICIYVGYVWSERMESEALVEGVEIGGGIGVEI